MNTWQLLRAIREAQKDPARIGEVPVYKGELTGARARPEIEAQMHGVRGYWPKVDLEALAKLPEGTLGREYARFLGAHGLHAIELTERCEPEMVARNAFTVRYAVIHDMVHVLTGFDPSWPGEVGVWAFVGGQHYSTGFRVAAFVSLFAALFYCPTRLGEAYRNFKRGWALGKRSEPLITLRLEDHFEEPVDVLRERWFGEVLP